MVVKVFKILAGIVIIGLLFYAILTTIMPGLGDVVECGIQAFFSGSEITTCADSFEINL